MDESIHFIDNDRIHEITVGIDPKQDLRFTVGNPYLRNTPNPIEITGIEIDQNYMTEHGIVKAKVFAKQIEKEDDEEFLWKVLVNIPLTITCKL